MACRVSTKQIKGIKGKVSQFTFFRKCTSRKSLRLLEFSIFFNGDFGSGLET